MTVLVSKDASASDSICSITIPQIFFGAASIRHLTHFSLLDFRVLCFKGNQAVFALWSSRLPRRAVPAFGLHDMYLIF